MCGSRECAGSSRSGADPFPHVSPVSSTLPRERVKPAQDDQVAHPTHKHLFFSGAGLLKISGEGEGEGRRDNLPGPGPCPLKPFLPPFMARIHFVVRHTNQGLWPRSALRRRLSCIAYADLL